MSLNQRAEDIFQFDSFRPEEATVTRHRWATPASTRRAHCNGAKAFVTQNQQYHQKPKNQYSRVQDCPLRMALEPGPALFQWLQLHLRGFGTIEPAGRVHSMLNSSKGELMVGPFPYPQIAEVLMHPFQLCKTKHVLQSVGGL